MDRFLSKISKSDTGCWLWKAALKANGYGTFRMQDGMRYAHRVSYEMFKGPVPDRMYVCHSCDVRNCVNPDHLWLGTAAENQQDMAAKGRTKSPAKRLSDETVSLIRASCMNATHKEVASQFGVTRSYVTRIANGVRRAGV